MDIIDVGQVFNLSPLQRVPRNYPASNDFFYLPRSRSPHSNKKMAILAFSVSVKNHLARTIVKVNVNGRHSAPSRACADIFIFLTKTSCELATMYYSMANDLFLLNLTVLYKPFERKQAS